MAVNAPLRAGFARFAALAVLLSLLASTAYGQELRPNLEVRGPVELLDVVDGDTVVVLSDLGPRTVRLIGIDSPEMNEGAPWLIAREALTAIAPVGSIVWIEVGREPEDRYGRLLAYLYLEDPAGRWNLDGRRGTQVNLAMVEGGWAGTLTIPPNDDYARLYASAETTAVTRGLGLWGGEAVRAEGRSRGSAVRLHCALVNPSTPNDTGAEWVSVWLDEPNDTTGYYLWDEGSRSTFRLPSGVQPAGEIRLVNPEQGVWNNSGDTIYLMRGGDVVDRWSYGRELAVEDRVACR